MDLEFDWRDTADKAARNLREHGVSFELATDDYFQQNT
jgi:uncharacterized DUF497 family protein